MDLKRIVAENKFLITLFVISTVIFICIHYIYTTWDFMVYSLNAKYWLGDSDFFEIGRAPLISTIMVLFSPLGWLTAEYFFIIFTSTLFFYSSLRLAKSLSVNKGLFYLFSLSPYVFIFGLMTGAELLSFALLELFVAALIEKKPTSGLFLGLACLSRYNFFIFAPLLVFHKDIKKMFQSGLLFVLPFIPWFIYNFHFTGNMLTSIVDVYLLNVKYRGYTTEPVNLSYFNAIISSLLPFFAVGIFCIFTRLKEHGFSVVKFLKNEGVMLIVLTIMVLSVYQYYKIPIKSIRYIFPLVLPVSYFSVIGAAKIHNKSRFIFKVLVLFVMVSYLLLLVSGLAVAEPFSKDKYLDAIKTMEDFGIDKCRATSNDWPIVNYYGKTTESPVREEFIQKSIDDGDFILAFYFSDEPDWMKNKTFLKQYPVIHETEDYILIGNLETCNPTRKVDRTYISSLHDYILSAYNQSINTNPCFNLFESQPFLEKTCNFVNLKGFKLDENRISEG